MTLVIRPGFAYDTDASNYIDAVEVADGLALETKTRYAINNFVIGCKSDGIWSAIKASCILAGARTKEGAITPLARASGTSPTLNGTAGGWTYNRKTGLKANGTDNYVKTGNLFNAEGKDNRHLATWVTEYSTLGGGNTYIGAHNNASGTVYSFIRQNDASEFALASTSSFTLTGLSTGFRGASRVDSANISTRASQFTQSATSPSGAVTSSEHYVFADNYPPPTARLFSNARLAFYSIGESLNLAQLDARVTDLINAFGVAIP
jgi:hypothetical protein